MPSGTIIRIGTCFAILGVLLSSAVSRAENVSENTNWKYVTADKKNGDRYFYEAGSVIPSGNNRIKFRMLVIRGNASKTWSDSEIDCRLKIISDLRTKTERSGTSTVFNNFPSGWRAISLETYGGVKIDSPDGAFFSALCR